VEAALGPPIYGASILSALASQTLETTTQLETILVLPYNRHVLLNSYTIYVIDIVSSDFKVDLEGTEISLFESIINTKASYENIQSNTIPIARDVQTFARLQQVRRS
jgi:hypothetical protein